jgi:predicted transcriptional regulator
MKYDSRRSQHEIIRDILKGTRSGTCITTLIYTTNLSYSSFKRRLDYLIAKGFIRKEGKLYRITAKGAKLDRKIDKELRLLGAVTVG